MSAGIVVSSLWMRVVGALAVSTSLAAAQHATTPPPPAGFRALDSIEGDQIDLVFMPVNPMVLSPDSTSLYAVNTHGSEVRRFVNLSGLPVQTYPAPWGPVSIAYWVAPDAHHELLVVSRGTHALTRIDPLTGNLLNSLELPSEPGGVLLMGNHLFVACSGDDVVSEVDLLSNTIFDRFDIKSSRHLLFLSQDGSNVLVSPMLSGNNTMTLQGLTLAGAHFSAPVQDMTDTSVTSTPLPDEDLFRLTPGATPFTGRVSVVAKGLGTDLFAHGINPVTGKLWILNTNARNQGPGAKGVAGLKETFTTSRLTLTTLPLPGNPPATSHTFVGLDNLDPITFAPGTFVAGDNLAKPYGLWFTSTSYVLPGFAFVVGASTDNVRVFDSNANRVAQWSLPPGSIPRAVLFSEVHQLTAVYCWGTNLIDVRDLGGNSVGRLQLGYDPSSDAVKQGRAIFFDARRSHFENATCETCHVEGLMDFLTWDNSPLPLDDKGPMFTQSLRGINAVRPYHWRGEQLDLIDFNGVFSALFGGVPLTTGPGSEFEKFQAYVFQLENPANPNEHPDRVVSNDPVITKFNPPSATHTPLSAVNGQNLYFTKLTVGPATCQDCHTLPTGTDSDIFEDGFNDQHHRSSFDVPAYNGLWRKEQKSRVSVQIGSGPVETRPPLGSGTSHAGLIPGLFEFITTLFPGPIADLEDIAFFMHQIDSGLAPAVHRERFLGPGSLNSTFISGYLIPQAQARNCDIAVVGRVQWLGVTRDLRWFWDRTLSPQKFVCEDPAIPPQSLTFFTNQATAGTGRNLFIGLPVGMGRRWAVDFDDDQLFNVAEATAGTNPLDPDTDHDGFLDGTEVAFGSDPNNPASLPADNVAPIVRSVRLIYKTARIAKLIVETSEPTRVVVNYQDGLSPPHVATAAGWKRLHTILLRDLEPSYTTTGLVRTYTGNVQAFDQANNPSLLSALPAIATESFITAFENLPINPIPKENIVSSLTAQTPVPLSGGGFRLTFDATVVNFKLLPPAALANHVAVARVILNGARTGNFVANGGIPPLILNFGGILGLPSLNGLYAYVPSAYLIGSISGANGVSTLQFDLPTAVTGDQVQLSIETVGEVNPAAFNPLVPVFLGSSLFEFPTTPKAAQVSAVITL